MSEPTVLSGSLAANFRPRRRAVPRAALFQALAALVLGWAAAAHAFDFNMVAARARQLASTPYKALGSTNVPRELRELPYERYHEIQFAGALPWRNNRLPFDLSFFHEGMVFDQPVRINEVVSGNAREIRFDPLRSSTARSRWTRPS